MADFPILTAVDLANGFHVCDAGEASLVADKFVLPDNFILRFAPAVRLVSWTFNEMIFGHGCTIDLAPTTAIPSKPARGADGTAFRQYGEAGPNGESGTAGEPGADGISLNLHTGAIASQGSLWIRTDGGRGGDGGDAGNGGVGGGWSCSGPFSSERRGNGGRGGDGGNGGMGGRGGNTADVTFTIGTVPPFSPVIPGCNQEECGPTTTMPSSVSNPASASGIVVPYGAPGCPGQGGKGGKGGGEAMDLQAVTKNASSAMSVGVLMEVTELMGNW